MIKGLSFLIFFLIPLLYILHKKDIRNFFYYIAFTYWFPVTFPGTSGGIMQNLKVPEFFIYAALLFYIINQENVKRLTQNYYQIPVFVKFSFFFIILGTFISITNSISYQYLFEAFRIIVLLPISLLFLMSRLFIDKKTLLNSIDLFYISTIILVIILLVHPKTAYFSSYRSVQEIGRLGGEYLFLNTFACTFYEATVGAFLGFITPFLFSISLFSIDRKERAKYFVFLFILIIALILTAGRSGWLGAFLGCTIVLIGYFSIRKKILRMIIFVFFAFFAVFFSVAYIVPSMGLDTVLLSRFLSFQNIWTEPNLLIRIYAWQWAYEIFLQNYFGIGLWNFEVITSFKYGGNSMWLNIMLDTGFIGFLGFLVLYLYSIKTAFQKLSNPNVKIRKYIFGALGSLFAIIPGATTESLSTSGFWAIFSVWLFIFIPFVIDNE